VLAGVDRTTGVPWGTCHLFLRIYFPLGITEQRQPCMPGWPHSMRETNRTSYHEGKTALQLMQNKGYLVRFKGAALPPELVIAETVELHGEHLVS
jgi:hypothetical protein